MMSRRRDNFQQTGSTQANYPVECTAHQHEGTISFNQSHQQQEQQWPFYQHHAEGGAFYPSQNTSSTKYCSHLSQTTKATVAVMFQLLVAIIFLNVKVQRRHHLPPSLSNAPRPSTSSAHFHPMASRPNATVALPSVSSVGFHHMASRPNATVALSPTSSA